MSALPAVVLQHRSDAPGGLALDVLEEQGFHPQIVRLDRDEPLPDPAAFRLAVTLGPGPLADGRETERGAKELDWLRQADRAGTAVLGLGPGAQALAVALGGAVDRAARPRHAWVWMSSSTPDWIARGPWLVWRDQVIRLPGRARVLAHDPVGPQVFGAGRHLGIQFHAEITREIVGGWVTAGNGTALDAQGILEVTSRELTGASRAARRLLSTYLHSLAGPPGESKAPTTKRSNTDD